MKTGKGFTLAEVLIVITIIGVIASMTIPTVVNTFKKQVYVNSLKKAYSTWAQIFDLMRTTDSDLIENLYDTEFFSGCPDSSSEQMTYINNELRKYIKMFTLEAPGNHSEDISYRWLSGQSASLSSIHNSSYKILNSDGIVYYLKMPVSVLKWVTIFADINGSKGPNILGRDLFLLYQIDDSGKILNPVYSVTDCDIALNGGYYCLDKIKSDGWKMNY